MVISLPPVCHLNKTLQSRSHNMPSIGTAVMRDLKVINRGSSLLTHHICYMIQIDGIFIFKTKSDKTCQHSIVIYVVLA